MHHNMAPEQPQSGSLQLQRLPEEEEDPQKRRTSKLAVLSKHNNNESKKEYGWIDEEVHLENKKAPCKPTLILNMPLPEDPWVLSTSPANFNISQEAIGEYPFPNGQQAACYAWHNVETAWSCS